MNNFFGEDNHSRWQNSDCHRLEGGPGAKKKIQRKFGNPECKMKIMVLGILWNKHVVTQFCNKLVLAIFSNKL